MLTDSEIVFDYVEVMASETPHEIESVGYCFPTFNKRYETITRALKDFNELIANEKTQKASVTLNMKYKESTRGMTSYSNTWFALANFNRQAKSFERYATVPTEWLAKKHLDSCATRYCE